jgi:hypothetical protein
MMAENFPSEIDAITAGICDSNNRGLLKVFRDPKAAELHLKVTK